MSCARRSTRSSVLPSCWNRARRRRRPRRSASIDQILKAGWYLLELINEILDLALIESGKLSLSLEPVSLAEVMLECQAMIEPQAQQARHRRDLSPFRNALLRQRRPHPGEAGSDQPAFQRHQIQPARTERLVVDCTAGTAGFAFASASGTPATG